MRNTKVWEAVDGRDKGKQFLLTEKPALQGEKWAARALCAMVNAGVQIPDELVGAGMAGIAAVGVGRMTSAGFRFPELEPLMDEMMGCVQVLVSPPDTSHVLPLSDDDIDEIPTVLKLRKEVLLLHLGFLSADAMSKLISMMASAVTSLSAEISPAPLPQ